MTFTPGGDPDPFPDYAERFVLAAWRTSREIDSGRTANLRSRQRQLFSLLTAMVQARMRRAAPRSEIDRGLRRLAMQAMRFAMCDPDNLSKVRLFAQKMGDRAFPLLYLFSGQTKQPLPALPPPSPSARLSTRNVIQIDFRAGRRR